jgi:hypothetical protein
MQLCQQDLLIQRLADFLILSWLVDRGEGDYFLWAEVDEIASLPSVIRNDKKSILYSV